MKLFKKKNDNVTGSSLLQIIFLFVALFLSALMASSLKFSLDKIKSDIPGFAIKTVTNFAIMMVSYKVVKHLSIKKSKVVKTIKHDEKEILIYTPYQKSSKDYTGKVIYINQNKLKPKVIAGVDKELNLRMIEAANDKLSSVTNDFTYDNIFKCITDENGNTAKKIITKEEIDQYCATYQLSKKDSKRLNGAIKFIINGKVKYDRFTANDVLIDSELSEKKRNNKKMTMSKTSYEINETFWKTVSYLFSTAIINSLFWYGLSTEFVVDLVKQGFLILNSVIGGIAAANAYLEYRKQIFDNRISFLNDCDINFPKTEQTN